MAATLLIVLFLMTVNCILAPISFELPQELLAASRSISGCFNPNDYSSRECPKAVADQLSKDQEKYGQVESFTLSELYQPKHGTSRLTFQVSFKRKTSKYIVEVYNEKVIGVIPQ